MSSDRTVRVYVPTAETKASSTRPAPRLASLRGTRCGILDNGKPNADILMLAIAERLRDAHGVAEVVTRSNPIGQLPPPDVAADLERCDFVIVGSAD